MTARLSLLLSSPRVVPGVLTREAWRALEDADLVMGRADDPQALAVADAGLAVDLGEPDDGDPLDPLPVLDPLALGRRLVDLAAAGQEVVWVVSSDGDPGLTDAVAAEVSRRPDPPEVEVVLGSHDAPGARLLDLVAVMDRLRSPGGCPWDAEQTHTSLVPFLVEEAHEAAEALEVGERDHVVEELGDVLLQVVFHARVGEEDETAPFDIDDVAAAIVAKLVRRHPHVFADGAASTPGEVETSWEAIKAAERVGTTAEGAGLLHGIPAGMPVLARATKVVSRVRRAGLEELLTAPGAVDDPGARLLALVAELTAAGVDPDAALRGALRRLVERVAPTTDPL